jgi:TrmH family RNA methyltransferase
MQNSITSLSNQKIKDVVKLRDRKARNELGLTIVEGHKEVMRALDADIEFVELFVYPDMTEEFDNAEIIEEINERGIPIQYVSEDVFKKISYGDRNEGLVAICKTWDTSIKNLKGKKDPLYVIAEGVEKPGNFGAILRTCDAVGVDAVIVCNGAIDIFNPNVIRASLGAIFIVNVVTAETEEAFKVLKEKNVRICATFPLAKDIYTDVDLTGPIAIAVGCEHDGLSDFWSDKADIKVSIPMQGQMDSLNVSSSAAVMLYESLRQRRNVGKK